MVDTKVVIDHYFRERPFDSAKKTRSYIDRPEVYDYEKKLGKTIFQMNSDELFDMIYGFFSTKVPTSSTVHNIISTFRSLFAFYIDNYEVIRNPFIEARWKGHTGVDNMLRDKEKITIASFENFIMQIRHFCDDFGSDRSDYFECAFMLAYDGLYYGWEYAIFTEEDIDFEKKIITLPDREIKLSDRTLELLQKVNKMTSVYSRKGYINLRSWNNSYFKFFCADGYEKEFDERDAQAVGNRLVYSLKTVKNSANVPVKFSLRTICILGFYEWFVGIHGREHAKEIVSTLNNRQNAKILKDAAKEYQIPILYGNLKNDLINYE